MTTKKNKNSNNKTGAAAHQHSTMNAQKWNNQGVTLIMEAGNFHAGIRLLAQALHCVQQDIDDEEERERASCNDTDCSLEASLAEQQYNSNRRDHDDTDDERIITDVDNTAINEEGYTNNTDDGEFFVYQTLHFLAERSIAEQHYMGNSTLGLIIVLNLAVAYHKQAMLHPPPNGDDATTTEYQTKAMKLYGLAYQLHVNIQQQQHEHEHEHEEGSAGGALVGSSLRLTLIIANNITDLHRRAGNTIKQQLCLEHLISLLLYYTTSTTMLHLPQQQQQHEADVDHGDTTLVVLSRTEFDGILRNASPIVFRNIYAPAA